MNKYIQPEDPQAFMGMEIKTQPMDWPERELCPKCKGYGGWHLRLNAYGEGVHFDSSCSQCWGWGWVAKEDAECIHQWSEYKIGKCLHEWVCKKCGRKRTVDSSD